MQKNNINPPLVVQIRSLDAAAAYPMLNWPHWGCLGPGAWTIGTSGTRLTGNTLGCWYINSLRA